MECGGHGIILYNKLIEENDDVVDNCTDSSLSKLKEYYSVKDVSVGISCTEILRLWKDWKCNILVPWSFLVMITACLVKAFKGWPTGHI